MTEEIKNSPGALIQKAAASGMFTGYMPTAPGTWGSFLACVVIWFVMPVFWYWQALVLVLFFPVAVYFAGVAEKFYGQDGRQIVIDEIFGQGVALFMMPHNIIAYALAFLLFRFFDIFKPYPIRSLEKIPGGRGIVSDDLVAGIYASISGQLILRLIQKFGVTGI